MRTPRATPTPKRARRAALACALLALALGAARPALAQSPDEIQIARQTAIDGLTAYKLGEFERALTLFEEARALYPSAQILRMAGYSHLALQHWQKAVDALEASLASEIGPLGEDDRKDVQEQLAKALAHFGTVTVSSAVLGAEVRIDGGPPRKLPLVPAVRLLEGNHKFVVSAPDHADMEQEIPIQGGKAVDLPIDPLSLKAAPPPPKPKAKPKPAPPPPGKGLFPGQREVGYAAAGAGLALGGAALVTALAGAGIRSQVEEDAALHEQHFGPSCEQGDYRLCVYDRAVINQDADRADTLRDASVWTGIGAAVLVAGGVTLVLLAPDGPLAPKAEPAPAPRAGAARPRLACGPLGAGLACSGAF